MLDDNPGLKPKRQERFLKAYPVARRDAAAETGLSLDRFPAHPPFGVEDVESREFWPASAEASPDLGLKTSNTQNPT